MNTNSQNESPFGNPRFVVSIIVVFLFLWGWQYYINKKYPQPLIKTKTATSTTTSVTVSEANTQTKTEENTKKETPVIAVEKQPETSFSYEDDKTKWQLSSVGMGLNSFELKTYTDREKNNIIFHNPAEGGKLFSLQADGQTLHFNITKTSDTEFVGEAIVDGKKIKRTLSYNKDTMSFDSTIEFVGQSPAQISLVTGDLKHEHSHSFLLPSFEKQDFLYREGEKIKTEHISTVKDGEGMNKSATNISLASVGTQYFTQSYIDRSDLRPSIKMTVVGKDAQLSVDYDLKNAKVSQLKGVIFVGAKATENLAKIDPNLPDIMDYGIFGFISKPLLVLMKFLHGIFGNWGVAIIALTLLMRLLMLPFNVVSFKSARAMQKVQPQLAAVREKYKDDPLRVNKETMAIMKEHNANPLSSCLPMLIQIPIFFALWRTIGSSIEIYQQPFFGWITDLSAHDHFFVLPVLMGITMFLQQKLTPTTMDPTQAKIMNFMPILFSLFMLSLPSGLTLYNFVSSLFGATQQYFLLRDTKKA